MCGSNRLSLPGKGLGGAPGPGGWAPRALGGLQVKRLVGRAPQLGDPWKACQRGGLLCVTPSPQGDPFAWGTCEGGGAPWAVGGGDPKCPALPWASKCSQGEGRRQPSSASPLTIHLGGTPSNRLSLSRPGWSRAAVAAGRGRAPAARGWQAVGGRAGPRAPGVGGAGGGRSRDAQPAPAATSILPRPVPARPSRNPRLQGCVGGPVPPLSWLEPSVRFPHPVGLRQAQAGGVRSGLPRGPATERDASPFLTRPAVPRRASLNFLLGVPGSPRTCGCVPGLALTTFSPGLGPQSLTRHLPSAWGSPPPASPRAEALVPSRACDPVVRGQRMKVKVALSCQLLAAPGTAQCGVSRCLSRGWRAPGSPRWTLGPVARWGMAGRGAGSTRPQWGRGGAGAGAERTLPSRRWERLVGTRYGGWRAESLEDEPRNGSVSPGILEPHTGRVRCSEPPGRRRESQGRERFARSPRPWRGWLGFCLGLAALGMERRGPEEGNAGRGEFLRGWGFWPWDLGPTQGPGAELGPTAGIQGVGSALPASVGPENRPPPRCRCSQWAQGRKMMSRLRRGPPPQPCQPPLPQATPGSLSGRAASPGQPHVVFLNPWPPCWAVEPGRGQASPPSGVWGGL